MLKRLENRGGKTDFAFGRFFDATDIPLLEKYDIETIVHNRLMIELLKAQAPYASLKVHIKINSGMNRLGFLPQEEEEIRAQLQTIEGVQVMGVVTHLPMLNLPTVMNDRRLFRFN